MTPLPLPLAVTARCHVQGTNREHERPVATVRARGSTQGMRAVAVRMGASVAIGLVKTPMLGQRPRMLTTASRSETATLYHIELPLDVPGVRRSSFIASNLVALPLCRGRVGWGAPPLLT